MPGLITVSEFVEETWDDYNSPTTSTFVRKMPDCRQTVANLEESLDCDRDGLTKMKKAVKAIHHSGMVHVENENNLSHMLDQLGVGGGNAVKDQEVDIATAFLKFSVVTKELSALMKTLMQKINNTVIFPLDTLLKNELRGAKGDLKKPFDKASKDYEAKYSKIEKEKKQQAKEAGLILTDINPGIADEMMKERRLFQLQMCDYLLKVNEIKTKKGIELLQHLVDYYHAQNNYFQDGLKTIEHFGSYVAKLSERLQQIKQEQEEEKKKLSELRAILRSAPGLEKEASTPGGGTPGTEKGGGYKLHQPPGDKNAGMTRSGHLLKKSDGKMRRVWQKRMCRVQAEGYLEIFHADETKEPTRVNLLTCQIKPNEDDKHYFDLISYNRTYHFQTDNEANQWAWVSVLVNCKEKVLQMAFDGEKPESSSLRELQLAIIQTVVRLPGNQACADCSAMHYNEPHADVTWLSTNFGVIVCIECSGVHREMGVHISRIQSLTLDHVSTSQLLLARHMTNQGFNKVMEANLPHGKLSPNSSMEERRRYIRAKYVDRKFINRYNQHDLLRELDHTIRNPNYQSLHRLLQVYAEGADLSAELPSSKIGETALHVAVSHDQDMGDSLHLVNFLVQNMSSQGLDKPTHRIPDRLDVSLNTPLHLCAIHDKPECMKLLLRSGAEPLRKNAQNLTPLDIACQKQHKNCEELLRHALEGQKSQFENVNYEWNLPNDEGSTDLSDDDTTADERSNYGYNGCVTPDKASRVLRPPSYPENSPVNMRVRGDEMLMPPPPNRKSQIANTIGSLKKRAPPPPAGTSTYNTLGPSHSRTPSDPLQNAQSPLQGYHTLNAYKRSPSTDSAKQLAGAKWVLPPSDQLPVLRPVDKTGTPNLSGVKRPLGPPPPAPGRIYPGRSNESLTSICSDADAGTVLHPVPPPRKPGASQPGTPTGEVRGSRDSLSVTSAEQSPNGGRGLEPGSASSGNRASSESLLSDVSVTSGSSKTREPPCVSGETISEILRNRRHNNKRNFVMRKVRALYDCEADREDELSFRVGDIIEVTNQHTDDDNWIEGRLESDPDHTGMFPISFVEKIPD